MRGLLRTDIQVLRAIAVLSVLIYHFDVPGLDKGFLGVDIFFVISGYLMAGVIMNEMDQGGFRAGRFYLRRARRLLPAAFATLLITTAAAPFVLPPTLLADYAQQLIGALTFSANIFLWQQSGYFDGSATLKPLLHTWSLSLEEQFYFVLPLVLACVGRRWRGAALLGLLLASAAACLWQVASDPSGTFYLLHTRAWELLFGALCALPGLRAHLHVKPRIDVAWLALPVLAFCLLQGVDPVHPRGDALLVCLATAALIVIPSPLLQSTRAWMRPLHWVGDRSYSLYLVHWPLISLSHGIWMEGVPPAVHTALLLLSFLLAHAMYEWIEQPFRHIESAQALWRRMLWLTLPLAAASALLWHKLHAPAGPSGTATAQQYWQQALRPNYGFARRCDQERSYQPHPECASTPQARTLVWGDSFAMHLVPALLASSPPGGIAQATRSACAPLLDMARQMPRDPRTRAQRCMAFNQSVLAYLAKAPHIDYVVLSSRWQYFFDDPIVNAGGQRVRPDSEALARSLGDTVQQLRKLGKKVIVVSPPPSVGPGVNLGLCAERRALKLWTVTPSTDAQCGFARSLHEERNGRVAAMLNETGSRAAVKVVHLDNFICDASRCQATLDGVALYRDAGHLSHDGSRLLGQRMDLRQLLQADAR